MCINNINNDMNHNINDNVKRKLIIIIIMARSIDSADDYPIDNTIDITTKKIVHYCLYHE